MSTLLEQPIRAVRADLSAVVDRAAIQPTIITRSGKPVAAVVSVDLLQHYEELEAAEMNRLIDERMANPAPGIPIAEVMRETLARDE
jgi:prevent-host-death family protein